MTQTSMASAGYARFCAACGGALPGPVPRCPRCGAVVAVKPRTSAGTIVAIIAVAVVGGVFCIGVLAAIAIPNFIRYQLRSKASEVTLNVQQLVRAEQQVRAATGAYLPIGPLPSAAPGPKPTPLSGEEADAVRKLEWAIGASTYGRYQVAVSADGKAAAVCAESDIDGDGERAVRVAFLPAAEGGEPPPAPCTRPVSYAGTSRPGEVVTVTEPSVF